MKFGVTKGFTLRIFPSTILMPVTARKYCREGIVQWNKAGVRLLCDLLRVTMQHCVLNVSSLLRGMIANLSVPLIWEI